MEKTVLEPLHDIPIVDEVSLVFIRRLCLEYGKKLHLSPEAVEKAAIIVSELGQNQIKHARGGSISLHIVKAYGGEGLEIIATDRGRGFSSIHESLEKKSEFGSQSLGSGLSSLLRLADEVDADVRLEEGTCIKARLYKKLPKVRVTRGIFGHAKLNLPPSGDHGGSRLFGSHEVFTVIDGLGHGPRARQSSDLLLDKILSAEEQDSFVVLSRGAESLTRQFVGGTAAVAIFNADQKEFFLGRAGDVLAVVINGLEVKRSIKQVPPLNFSLLPRNYPQADRIPLFGKECWLLMFSDGLSSFAADCPADYFKKQHPVIVAEEILREFDKKQDDALVLAAHFCW